jgi:hypothetical protein
VAVAVSSDGGRSLRIFARELHAPGVARARQRLFELGFEHRLQEFARPVVSKRCPVVSISDCSRQCVVIVVVMAWSPSALKRRNRLLVVTWLWSYITFQRGARLITEVPPPLPSP